LRTRLAIAEDFQLGFQSLLDGPFDDGLANIDGQGFDGIEVDVESRPFVSKGTTGNDFPPSVGKRPTIPFVQCAAGNGPAFPGVGDRIFTFVLAEMRVSGCSVLLS
jgi:hypothetical protein